VGRTLGAGIRDFRQALSGDTPPRQDSGQVETTTTEPHDPPPSESYDVNWPEDAVGPTSYDEPVEAAAAEPESGEITDFEPATAATTDPEPATAVATDPEPATAVVTEAEPATEVVAAPPHAPDLDALYFDAPAGETTAAADRTDSAESHVDQSS
jgi:hypothetical protein